MKPKRALVAIPALGLLAALAGATVLGAPSTASADPASPWTNMNFVFDDGTPVINEEDGTLTIIPDRDYTSESSTRKLTSSNASLQAADLPEKFDLRDATFKNTDGEDVTGRYVTNTKFQNPFGDCWVFGLTAAAESSYMSETGQPYDLENLKGLDFSEKHTAWFSFTPVPEGDAFNQSGEGLYSNADLSTNSGDALNHGGSSHYGTTVFAAGVGPIDESYDESLEYHNAAGEYDDRGNGYVQPAATGDWSIDPSLRRIANAELEESYLLPSPASWEANGDGTFTFKHSEEAVNAIKEQLVAGRGVTVSYTADSATGAPGGPAPTYINPETWAQYTYGNVATNHAVCIVGYDDTYSKTNFLADHQPPEDGAFIVKNSWGGKNTTYGNIEPWGLDGDGYFYISYYDQSLSNPEAYDFVTPNDDDLKYGKNYSDYEVDYYRYANLAGNYQTLPYPPEFDMKVANVYEMVEPSVLRSVSVQTRSFDTDVTFEIYRLNDGAKNPDDGELVWTTTEHYPYGGLHRVEVDDPIMVSKGEKLGVVINTVLPDGKNEVFFNAYPSELYGKASTYTKSGSHGQIWGETRVNPGESYMGAIDPGSPEREWMDFTDFIAAQREPQQQAWDASPVPQLIDERDRLLAKIQADPSEDDVATLTKAQTALSQWLQQHLQEYSYVLNVVDNFPITLAAEPVGNRVARLYNPNSGEHLFTADENEIGVLMDAGWALEDLAWTSPDEGAPIYRLYNPNTKEHLYTMDENERVTLVNVHHWTDEGVKLHSDANQTTPVERLYNPNMAKVAAHLYTTDLNEAATLEGEGWTREGAKFYGL